MGSILEIAQYYLLKPLIYSKGKGVSQISGYQDFEFGRNKGWISTRRALLTAQLVSICPKQPDEKATPWG